MLTIYYFNIFNMKEFLPTALFLFATFFISTLLNAQKVERKPQIKNLHSVINSRVYPEMLKINPIEGKVIFDIWINREGDITQYAPIEFDNDTLRAFVETRIPLLEFEPARNDFGVTVNSKVRIPFEFSLPSTLAKN